MQQRPILAGLILASLVLAGCASKAPTHLAVDSPTAQFFEGLGDHGRKVTTGSTEAQAYFDQGLTWLYAFNHDEAIRSFARAAEIDPDCAMAWWGIALAEGPNYNDPVMTKERTRAAWSAMQEALARIDDTSPLERALIEALATRYSKRPKKDRTAYEQAYAEAMADVWEAYPDDPVVGALYAEALMVKRPWRLYSAAGEPEGETPHIVETLERVLELDPGNPGANHLYIHAVEPSSTPERGVAAADRLCDQVPGAGHLNHMPSHIYVQVGQWDKSVEQNAKAMEADARYRTLSPDQSIQHMYMVHNAHMLAYSAMMAGREEEAMAAARAMWADVPTEVMPAVAPYLDLWMTSVYDVQKRFGRWDDLLAEPAPPSYMPITTAVWHAHRAIAHAAKHEFEEAEREQALFRDAREAIPEESVFGGDPSRRILEVSESFILGEIALQKEEWERAAEALEQAVEVEDTLSYGEPPQWLQPTRHTLGAVYLSAGRFEDAERVYREDLKKWRENGWSLYGLSRALEGQGKTAEAAEVTGRYEAAWAKADEPTTTSCKCIPSI
jgi:tetratricopeptide (TPR) repeat protein